MDTDNLDFEDDIVDNEKSDEEEESDMENDHDMKKTRMLVNWTKSLMKRRNLTWKMMMIMILMIWITIT